MSNCYEYETYNFKKPLLDIDVTYIIHLKDNGRYDSIIDQITKYNISKKVIIVLNKGYKKCSKDPSINKPPLDLVDAYLEIFKNAKEAKYDNILILEDDFFFDDKIKDPFHRNNINEFINTHSLNIFYLGCIPCLLTPRTQYTYNGFTLGAHSVIYSKEFIKETLNNKNKINDWDMFLNNKYFNKYIYYTPLCFQLFPETENSKYWGSHDNILYFLAIIAKYLIKIVGLDKNTNGYFIMYFLSKIWLLLLILIIIKCIWI